MKIQTKPLGMFGANCYILTDAQQNCVLIDPAESASLLSYFKENNLQLKAILLTHGHFDHIWGVKDLKEKTGAMVVCHAQDVELLHCPSLAANSFGQLPCPSCDADQIVADGDTLQVGEMSFTFYHTPGHSKGSMIILTDGALFTGDTVFAGSVGRTDLYGGNSHTLIQSIKRIAALKYDGVVYPGHGEETTLEQERRTNPYFLRATGKDEGVSYDDLF